MNSRLPIVLLLIVSLVVSGATRRWSVHARASGKVTGMISSGELSRMNSYSLALLLGGLRGPLVMFLWQSAERQKAERNLEDFDTKIEWIRLLQAEFDSVHIYQIWNKAYNISAQLANLGNKYQAILDALEYGRNVDAERPNNINITVAIAQLFDQKLGTSQEKDYYRQRVRDESMPRQPMVRVTIPITERARFVELTSKANYAASKLRFTVDETGNRVSAIIPKTISEAIRSDMSGPNVEFVDRPVMQADKSSTQWVRRELDPMLDDKGMILPDLVKPINPRPADLNASSEWNDGSELQYLKQFEPYHDGISTLALGYNYNKRAQVLMTVNHQKHSQLSGLVIDSRPAISLREWSYEEWDRARNAEIEGFGRPFPPQKILTELTVADIGLDEKIAQRTRIQDAIYSYGRGDQVIDAARKEYDRHLTNDKTNLQLYQGHVEEINAQQWLMRGDRDFLAAMLATGDDRTRLSTTAAAAYRKAAMGYQIVNLKTTVGDELAARLFPPGITKANISERLDADQTNRLYSTAKAIASTGGSGIEGVETMMEIDHYISRALLRLKHLPQ